MIRLKKILKISSFILLPLIIIWSMIFGWGWFVPYSLQPSYHEFKEMCKLEPKIYQSNGGKIDKEYYNKLLAYFNTNFEEVLQGNKGMANVSNSQYIQRENIELYSFNEDRDKGRLSFSLGLDMEKNKTTNEILPLKKVFFYVEWYNRRKYLTTKSVASYELEWRENYENFAYFKKEIK
ncbi:hypothetical protein P9E95_001744 [Campylobacter jejuni]|nr:hypothetical protein [Campylobacter jejuni]